MRYYAGVCAGYLGNTEEGNPPRGAAEDWKVFLDARILRPDRRVRRNKTGSAEWWKVGMCSQAAMITGSLGSLVRMLQRVSDSSQGVGNAKAGKTGWVWITNNLVCQLRKHGPGPGSPLASPALTPVGFVSC